MMSLVDYPVMLMMKKKRENERKEMLPSTRQQPERRAPKSWFSTRSFATSRCDIDFGEIHQNRIVAGDSTDVPERPVVI
jgi:hypothetical protein